MANDLRQKQKQEKSAPPPTYTMSPFSTTVYVPKQKEEPRCFIMIPPSRAYKTESNTFCKSYEGKVWFIHSGYCASGRACPETSQQQRCGRPSGPRAPAVTPYGVMIRTEYDLCCILLSRGHRYFLSFLGLVKTFETSSFVLFLFCFAQGRRDPVIIQNNISPSLSLCYYVHSMYTVLRTLPRW